LLHDAGADAEQALELRRERLRIEVDVLLEGARAVAPVERTRAAHALRRVLRRLVETARGAYVVRIAAHVIAQRTSVARRGMSEKSTLSGSSPRSSRLTRSR